MNRPSKSPCGSWKSPITTDLIVCETVRLAEPAIQGDSIYWLEGRPQEQGRYVVVRHPLRAPAGEGESRDVTHAPFNVRSRVHEYGGGAYLVAGEILYFSNFADNRLYRMQGKNPAEPITPDSARRYADLILDPGRARLLCVCEDHSHDGVEPTNTLVAVPLGGAAPSPGRLELQTMAEGHDFYSSPRLSPDEFRLAWLAWDHPNMPWDGTELWVGEIAPDGSISGSERVAGGPEESIFQPEWSPDGVLHFISDRTGWWNLYRWKDGRAEPLWEKQAEFGVPQWVFGLSTYAFESEHRIVCTYLEEGAWRLAIIDTVTLGLRDLHVPYSYLHSLRARPGTLVCIAGSPSEVSSVIAVDLDTEETAVLRRSSNANIDPGYLSAPEAIMFPSAEGRMAHALYYPPVNRDFESPDGEQPPLIVASHGGPTSAARPVLELSTGSAQFWTSRGFAFVDVDYGGSTGYGRAYREVLYGRWGIVDVEDCVAAARYLAQRGAVDPHRLAIRGGSAGGYTTLCALTFTDQFQAGASYFGVSDLEALARDTHKFESRYMDKLVGPYPERADLYRERSPIHYVQRLSCPVIFFQGLEDRVVPPNQAEMLADALRAKGVPVAYVAFEDERHGFHHAASIKRCLEDELFFYSRIFGFTPADPISPVKIENLP